MFFTNEHCSVAYNFWTQEGNTSFAIFNKTEEVIFFHPSESYLVINQKTHDVHDSKDVVRIPSHTYRVFSQPKGDISAKLETNAITEISSFDATASSSASVVVERKTPRLYSTILQDSSIDVCPRSESKPRIYGVEESPVKFLYHICYSVGSQDAEKQNISNEFYVNEMKNVNGVDFSYYYYVPVTDNGSQNDTQKVTIYKYKAPNRFFLEYTY